MALLVVGSLTSDVETADQAFNRALRCLCACCLKRGVVVGWVGCRPINGTAKQAKKRGRWSKQIFELVVCLFLALVVR